MSLSVKCNDLQKQGKHAMNTAPLKLRKTESSCLKEIPLQMLPMGMWGPENMKILKIRWGLFDF